MSDSVSTVSSSLEEMIRDAVRFLGQIGVKTTYKSYLNLGGEGKSSSRGWFYDHDSSVDPQVYSHHRSPADRFVGIPLPDYQLPTLQLGITSVDDPRFNCLWMFSGQLESRVWEDRLEEMAERLGAPIPGDVKFSAILSKEKTANNS